MLSEAKHLVVEILRRWLRMTTLLLAILFSSIPVVLYAGNLLTSTTGTFENGTINYWNPTPTTLPAEAYRVETATVYAGGFSLYISTGRNSASNVGMYNNVSVTAAQKYNLAGWFWNNQLALATPSGFFIVPGGGGASGVTVLPMNNSTSTVVDSDQWQFLNMSTQVAAGVTVMGVSAYARTVTGAANVATSYFDNIYFGQPSSPVGLTQLAGNVNISTLVWTNSSLIISSFTQSGSVSGSVPADAVKFYLEITSVTTGGNVADWSQSWHASTSTLMSEGTTGYQWPTLTDNGTYWWQVWSEDKYNNVTGSTATVLGAGSEAKLIFDNKPPGGISNLTALTGSTAGSIKLQWTCPGNDYNSNNLPSGSLFRINYSSINVVTAGNFTNISSTFAAVVDISTSAVAGSEQSYTKGSLLIGQKYWFAIKTIDPAGNYSVWNSTVPADIGVNTAASTVTVSGLPSAPTNLTVALIGTTSVQWQFDDNSSNEDGLFISTGPVGNPSTWISENLGPKVGGGTTSWWHIALATITQYTVYAGATNTAGASWTSAVSTYTLAAVPAVFVATTTNSSTITLSWNANNNPTPATKYGVRYATATDFYVSTTAVNFASGLIAATTDIYNLSSNTTYYFRLWAYNGAEIETSYVSDSTTTAPTPAGPTGLLINEVAPAVTGGLDWVEIYVQTGGNYSDYRFYEDSTARKTFPASFNPSSGDYIVVWFSSGSGTVDEDDISTKGVNGIWDFFTADTGLASTDEVLSIRKPAVIADNNWIDAVAYSNRDGGTTATFEGNYNTAISSNAWTGPLGDGVTGTDADAVAVQSACANISTITATTSTGRNAFFTDTNSYTDWSITPSSTPGSVNYPIPDTTTPSPISNLTALTGSDDGQVILQWTSPGDDGTAGNLTGAYEIKHSSTGIISNSNYDSVSAANTIVISTVAHIPLTAYTRTVTGLLSSSLYYFAIKARDEVSTNWSVWNSSADVLTVNTSAYAFVQTVPPNNISDLTALTGTNEGEVLLKWTAPGDNLAVGPITGGAYWLKYSTNSIGNESGFTSAATFTVKSTDTVTQQPYSTTVTGLNPGTSYYFALKYRDEVVGNWASWSTGTYNTLSSTASMDIPPPAPTGLSVIAGNTKITLYWTPVSTSTTPDVAFYNIYRDSWNAGASYVLLTSTMPNGTTYYIDYIDTGLRNGNRYDYKISSLDTGDLGNGLYSAALSSEYSSAVSTAPFILPPALVSANYSGSNVNLVWTHSPDFTAGNFSAYKIYYSTVSGGYYILAGSTLTGTGYTDPIVSPR
ncbi:MAG: fibronectin type III domain-containing protein, partial [Elusimicrobiota bacterium]|nr:fibronectin type III domain-containing protein [Elusimicrobiota bacterium]